MSCVIRQLFSFGTKALRLTMVYLNALRDNLIIEFLSGGVFNYVLLRLFQNEMENIIWVSHQKHSLSLKNKENFVMTTIFQQWFIFFWSVKTERINVFFTFSLFGLMFLNA